MSRILKRPMFRTGGSPNEGIMHGLVDRKRYATGSIDEERLGADVSAIKAAMDKYAPLPESRFPLGQIGLNLVSGEFAGDGLLANIAGSARDPYASFVKADEARNLAESQRTGSAISSAIGQQFAERTARAKATSNYLKDETVERQYKSLLTTYSDRPEAKMNWTEENIFPHSFATLYSDIKLNASKSPQGQDLWRKFVGVLPNKRQSGRVTEWKYDEMNSGAIYFHPTEMAFFEKVPSVKDDNGNVIEPAHVLKINPYTFEVIEKKVLPGLE